MTILEHLYLGGVIRLNVVTREIQLVRDSMEITDVICAQKTLDGIINLLKHRVDGVTIVYSIADQPVTVTQADREAFRAILECADEDLCLPGNVSYQDVFDLCAKFNVPAPRQTVEKLFLYQGLSCQKVEPDSK